MKHLFEKINGVPTIYSNLKYEAEIKKNFYILFYIEKIDCHMWSSVKSSIWKNTFWIMKRYIQNKIK
jgi:hypothetical protein